MDRVLGVPTYAHVLLKRREKAEETRDHNEKKTKVKEKHYAINKRKKKRKTRGEKQSINMAVTAVMILMQTTFITNNNRKKIGMVSSAWPCVLMTPFRTASVYMHK